MSSDRASKKSEIPDQLRGPETLSQLLARILDQLSVGAWLPAAALVSLLVVIGNLRLAHGNVHKTITAISSLNAASLVLLAGAVVMTTMLTQAFAFEGIRILEGYWGHGRIRDGASDWLYGRNVRRRNELKERAKQLDRDLMADARQAMLGEGIPREVVDLIEDRRLPNPTLKPSAEIGRWADAVEWLSFAPAAEVRRLERILAALHGYPRADALVMPTRLGNALRAREEDALGTGTGRDPEGFIESCYHELPLTMQIDHDQRRSRLDLYTSLIVVFAITGLAGAFALALVEPWVAAGIALTAMALIALSYQAAVVSARAYGRSLVTVAEFNARRSEL